MDVRLMLNAQHLHHESVQLSALARSGLIHPEEFLEFEARATRFVEDAVRFLDELLHPLPPF